jgi:hypothetical protein
MRAAHPARPCLRFRPLKNPRSGLVAAQKVSHYVEKGACRKIRDKARPAWQRRAQRRRCDARKPHASRHKRLNVLFSHPMRRFGKTSSSTRSITNVSRESREFASCKNVLSGVIWNSPVEKRAAVDAAFITKRSGNYSMHSFSPVDQSLDRLLNQRHVTQVPPRMLEDHD